MTRSRWFLLALGIGLVAWLAACSSAPTPAPTAAPAPAAKAAAPAAPAEKPAATSRQPVQLRALVGPFGTGGYSMGFALGEMLKNNHPYLRMSPGESPGYIYNIKAIENPALWDNTVIGLDSITRWLAAKGDPIVGQQVLGARGLFTTAASANHLLTLDPNIKNPGDLKGKRVGLGLKTQAGWGVALTVSLEHGWGVTEKNADLQYIGPNPAKDALMNGRVDAGSTNMYLNPFTKVYTAASQLIEVASGPRPPYHLPWGKEQTEDIIKKTGMPVVPVTIPAGALSTIKQDLDLWAFTQGYAVKDVFPEEYAYELVKVAFQNIAKFGEYDAQGKLMSPDLMTYGWGGEKNLHPGAVRAYKELGVKISEQ